MLIFVLFLLAESRNLLVELLNPNPVYTLIRIAIFVSIGFITIPHWYLDEFLFFYFVFTLFILWLYKYLI